jgi:hypothetical protein
LIPFIFGPLDLRDRSRQRQQRRGRAPHPRAAPDQADRAAARALLAAAFALRQANDALLRDPEDARPFAQALARLAALAPTEHTRALADALWRALAAPLEGLALHRAPPEPDAIEARLRDRPPQDRQPHLEALRDALNDAEAAMRRAWGSQGALLDTWG